MLHPFDELENARRSFVAAREWRQFHSPKNMAICVSVEAAELLELYTWVQDADKAPPGAEAPATERVSDEAGDIFLSLLSFCESTGIDLLAAARKKLSQLEERYPVDSARGSAVKAPDPMDEL